MHRYLPAVVLLLVTCPGVAAAQDLHAWKWQRTILTAAVAGEQCVVLDSELFAHAAPGLRDLRVLQQGHTVPYALEESFDESAVSHPAQDRALYTPVLRIPLQASDAAWPEPDQHSSRAFRGQAVLAAHVPAERIQLELSPDNASKREHVPIAFTLAATPQQQPGGSYGTGHVTELLTEYLSGDTPTELTAIGANLQNSATVSVAVSSERFAAVLLQMRRRLLCVRPISDAPLRMVFGSEEAKPVRYDSMAHYHPSPSPTLAQMGPVQPNPFYRSPVVRAPFWTLRRLALMVCIFLLATALIAATPMLLPQRY